MQAQDLFTRVDAQLTDRQRQFIRPMAALAVRFSGKKLKHAGKAASSALELLLARAPASTAWRGVVINGATSKRFAASRPVTAAGLGPLKAGLSSLSAMPPRAFQVYLKDGSKEVLAPDTFAAWLSLASTGEDTFATPRGFLSAAFPLEELERPEALITLVDQLVEVLGAEAAWLGPAVWLAPHCLFNSASNELPDHAPALIELFGASPQLDAPHLYASRWPHGADEVKPDHFSGLLAPSWAMWLDAALAKKVKTFPGPMRKGPRFTRYLLSDEVPFVMTEETYGSWRAGWEALRAVHLRCSDQSVTGKYFRGRLSGEAWAGLRAAWSADHDAARAKAKRAGEFGLRLRALREAGSAEIVAVAEQARGVMAPESLCWDLMPALAELISGGKVAPPVGLVWLDFGEEHGVWKGSQRAQTAKDAAAVAAACGAADRAFMFLRESFTDHRGEFVPPVRARKNELARDRRFTSLRTFSAWKRLVSQT